MGDGVAHRQVRTDLRSSIRKNDSNRLDTREKRLVSRDARRIRLRILRVWLLAVFREHGGDNVDDNVQLGLVSSGNIYEDIARVQGDLAVLRVDNGRHRKNRVVRVVDDGVDRRVADDRQVFRQVLL